MKQFIFDMTVHNDKLPMIQSQIETLTSAAINYADTYHLCVQDVFFTDNDDDVD